MLTRQKLTFSLAILVFAVSASAGSVYVVTGSQQFGTVDLTTGAFHQIAKTPEPDANLTPGPGGSLYSLGTLSGDLVSINPANGTTSVIGPTGLGSSAFSLGEVGGKLFLTDFSNNLYTVNAATGAATKVGPTGLPPDPTVPFTFNADGTLNLCDEFLVGMDNKLYAAFDSFKINPTNLAVTQVVTPNLWQIDPSTGKATVIAPTTLSLDSLVDVNGTSYTFHLITTGFSSAGPDVANQLMTLDLANGDTSFVRNIDTSAGPIFGAAPTPEPGSIGLAMAGIVSLAFGWRRRRAA